MRARDFKSASDIRARIDTRQPRPDLMQKTNTLMRLINIDLVGTRYVEIFVIQLWRKVNNILLGIHFNFPDDVVLFNVSLRILCNL